MLQRFKSTRLTSKALKQYRDLLLQVLQRTQGKWVLISIIDDYFETFKACFSEQQFSELKQRVGAFIIVDPLKPKQRTSQSYQFFTDVFSPIQFTDTFEEADAIALNTVGLPFL